MDELHLHQQFVETQTEFQHTTVDDAIDMWQKRHFTR